jgi:hypothetical protein
VFGESEIVVGFVTFSLPRGERMRCGVFLFAIFCIVYYSFFLNVHSSHQDFYGAFVESKGIRALGRRFKRG